MMNKNTLVRFISKYHLGGNVNSVAFASSGEKLGTRFQTEDETVIGEVVLNSWKYTTLNFGIYDTEQLLKIVGILDNDININLKMAGDKPVSLELSDGFIKANCLLSDLSIIPKVRALKKLPEFELELELDKKFIDAFIAGKQALADEPSFTIVAKEDGIQFVIGYSSLNTNRITLPVKSMNDNKIDNVSFNARIFREILIANKECEVATMKVSSAGLAKLEFIVDDFVCVYYAVPLEDFED